MSSNSPTIYLLHGNDEFAIHSFLEEQLNPKWEEQLMLPWISLPSMVKPTILKG